ncbi:MAG: hypothetical protein QXE31_04525 [Candidatus Woesearchaeota archaeon]
MENPITFPFMIFAGIIVFMFVFLETYRHFPKMEKQKRIEYSLSIAIIMALAIMAILYFALNYFMAIILNSK